MNYQFVANFNDNQVEEQLISFYQIASFCNPKTHTYHIRRFIVNDNNEFVNIRDHYIDKRRYHKLLKIKKPNQYKVYSVYDLNNINYPSMGDVLGAKSSMISSNTDYYGAAPF